MSVNVLDLLPEPHHSTVRDELDTGERLLWAGTPDPGAWARQALPVTLFCAMILGGLGALMGLVVARQWFGAEGVLAYAPGPDKAQGATALIGLTVVAAVLLLGALVGPFVALGVQRGRALRTVYGITPTRIFSVRVLRDGRRQMSAIEPGHPLATLRIEHRRGTGDVHLYPNGRAAPGGGPTAQFSLMGIARPREVERFIRATFDPPAPSAS